jgi:hypothetical protein
MLTPNSKLGIILFDVNEERLLGIAVVEGKQEGSRRVIARP